MGDDVVEGMVPGESMADMAPTPHYLPWSRPHPSQDDTKTWTCRNCQCRNPLAIQRCSVCREAKTFERAQPVVNFECVCGFTGGTKSALDRHLARYPGSDFNEQGDSMDSLRASYGRVHRPVSATVVNEQQQRLVDMDRAHGEGLFKQTGQEEILCTVRVLLQEHGVLSAQGLQHSTCRDCGIIGVDRSKLPSSTFLNWLQDNAELCACRLMPESGGWMVGGTHSQLDKFEQLQSQQQLVTDARRTEEEARELESALQAQNEDSSVWQGFYDQLEAQETVACYSAARSWSEDGPMKSERSHRARAALVFFESAAFVLKVRHSSRDQTADDPNPAWFNHENDWYRGKYATGLRGDTLRLSVSTVARGVSETPIEELVVEPYTGTFEAVPNFGVDGKELLELTGHIPGSVIVKEGLDTLHFSTITPEFL